MEHKLILLCVICSPIIYADTIYQMDNANSPNIAPIQLTNKDFYCKSGDRMVGFVFESKKGFSGICVSRKLNNLNDRRPLSAVVISADSNSDWLNGYHKYECPNGYFINRVNIPSAVQSGYWLSDVFCERITNYQYSNDCKIIYSGKTVNSFVSSSYFTVLNKLTPNMSGLAVADDEYIKGIAVSGPINHTQNDIFAVKACKLAN